MFVNNTLIVHFRTLFKILSVYSKSIVNWHLIDVNPNMERLTKIFSKSLGMKFAILHTPDSSEIIMFKNSPQRW